MNTIVCVEGDFDKQNPLYEKISNFEGCINTFERGIFAGLCAAKGVPNPQYDADADSFDFENIDKLFKYQNECELHDEAAKIATDNGYFYKSYDNGDKEYVVTTQCRRNRLYLKKIKDLAVSYNREVYEVTETSECIN